MKSFSANQLFILLAAVTIALFALVTMEEARPRPATPAPVLAPPAAEPASEPEPQDETIDTESATEQNGDIYSCEFWKDKDFATAYFDDFAGTATLGGVVRSATEIIWDEEVTMVYFEISPPQENPAKAFYQYFMDTARKGNTVNTRDGDMLQFTLGILENGTIQSTADISESTQQKLQNALGAGTPISLKFVVPIYLGMGAPAAFSFACSIE